jgi:hypothetical protein
MATEFKQILGVGREKWIKYTRPDLLPTNCDGRGKQKALEIVTTSNQLHVHVTPTLRDGKHAWKSFPTF